MANEDNMKLWKSVCTTNPSDTKGFKGKGGFQGTAICAQSQRRVATEQWGPFGDKWGIRDETYDITQLGDDFHNTVIIYRGTLYYPTGEFGLCSDIDMFTYSLKYKNWSRNNDVCKKARTDALTKGLSELGFNADVFLGKFDDNKYVQEQRRKEQAENAPPPSPPQQQAPPTEPPSVGQILAECLKEYGHDKCAAAKLALIFPSPEGRNYVKEDQITTNKDAAQLRLNLSNARKKEQETK